MPDNWDDIQKERTPEEMIRRFMPGVPAEAALDFPGNGPRWRTVNLAWSKR